MSKSHMKFFLSLLLFGSNGFVSSFIGIESYKIVFFRTLFGSLFLLLLFKLNKGSFTIHKNLKDLCYISLSGMSMGMSWICLFETYRTIGVSLGTITYYTGPMIFILFTPLVFKERIHKNTIYGFIFVLLGMVSISGISPNGIAINFGMLAGILSAFTYALMLITYKKLSISYGMEGSLLQLIFSFVILMIYTLSKGGITSSDLTSNVISILWLGIVNTGIGCYLYFSSIQFLSTTTVSLGGYLEPLSALIFSVTLLGERLTLLQTIGAVLIILGVIFSDLSKFKKHQG